MAIFASIDTGGTFTDGLLNDGVRSVRVKVETTPHDFTECFMDCLSAGANALGYEKLQAAFADTAVIRFASTIATNALIERKGPRVGVLVSPGAKEQLYANGPSELYAQLIDDPGRVLEVTSIEDEDAVRRQLRTLLQLGARVIVVSLASSQDQTHLESSIKKLYEASYPRHYLGAVPCLLSSELTECPDDELRTNAAVVNAFIHPEFVRMLYKAEELVRTQGYNHPLLAVNASGGVSRIAKACAVELYNSGPAAGVFGSMIMAKRYDLPAAVSVDIGGTSTDCSVIRSGEIPFITTPSIEGIPAWNPTIDVRTFGCGGNSVVSEVDGKIMIGPRSMGASPGPAAYGLGGTVATPTDAHLVLGTLDPDYYLGGRRKLDADASRLALSKLCDGDVELAARQIYRAVVASVADRVGPSVSGLGPEAALFAFGGGGGLFGADIARELGLKRVFIFEEASVFSAFGVSEMDVSHLYDFRLFALDDADMLLQELTRLEERALLDMAGEGFPREQVKFELEAITGVGVTRIPIDSADRSDLGARVRAMKPGWLRLRSTAPLPRAMVTPRKEVGGDVAAAQKGTRVHCLTDPAIEVPVFDRAKLVAGMRLDGPAIVEAVDCTILVPPYTTLRVDGFGAAILEIGGD